MILDRSFWRHVFVGNIALVLTTDRKFAKNTNIKVNKLARVKKNAQNLSLYLNHSPTTGMIVEVNKKVNFILLCLMLVLMFCITENKIALIVSANADHRRICVFNYAYMIFFASVTLTLS